MEQKTNSDEPRTVSAFEHENALMHYGRVNKRMLVALLSICVTFIVVTLIFVMSYTAREREWINLISDLITPDTEVTADGVYEQPHP